MPLHLRLAVECDVPAMARVGVAAFANDTINLALFPPRLRPADDPGLDERLSFRLARTMERMRKPGAHAVVVVDDSLPEGGNIVGFAQWESPTAPGALSGQGGNTDEELATGSPEQYPRTFDKVAYDELYTRMDEEEARVFGSKGRRNAWYCIVLGVDPAHQRRGIGRMLANWGVERAASERRDCYLVATPAGIPLYLSLGFQDLGRFNLFGTEHSSMLFRKL
ncbi:putative GNAT family acetyltransferase [Thozetella sp. PMI_491]|nr:putative GNAT family acetyltransferase [Thozetella sp. PMI_491]